MPIDLALAEITRIEFLTIRERTGIADKKAAGFEHQLAAKPVRVTAHNLGVTVRVIGVGIVGLAIGNAQSAAKVEMRDRVAVGAQEVDKIGKQCEGVVKGLQVGDLRADVHVDAADQQARQLGRAGIGVPGA